MLKAQRSRQLFPKLPSKWYIKEGKIGTSEIRVGNTHKGVDADEVHEL